MGNGELTSLRFLHTTASFKDIATGNTCLTPKPGSRSKPLLSKNRKKVNSSHTAARSQTTRYKSSYKLNLACQGSYLFITNTNKILYESLLPGTEQEN